MMRSDEARQIDVDLPGLAAVFQCRTLGNLPIIGRLLHPILGLEPVGAIHRRRRAIIFAVAAMHEKLGIELYRVERELELNDNKVGFKSGHDTFSQENTTMRFREIMKLLQMRFI